jgi:putative Mg2+ transporter-C (MgtC) family protein
MDGLPIHLGWPEIAIRLAFATAAGAIIGFNRTEHGRPAGIRTTMLVCLAAAVAMIEANLLLATTGKSADSFARMDILRLPLGILSGIGFIGGGVILKRGDIVLGVTTAATMWFVTVLGLCFGGGQLVLVVSGLGLSLVVLWGLKLLERYLRRDRSATLAITAREPFSFDADLQRALHSAGFKIARRSVQYRERGRLVQLEYLVQWHGLESDNDVPAFINELAQRPEIQKLGWRGHGTSAN